MKFDAPARVLHRLEKGMAYSTKETGFTLIELMIVVAILGVLSAVAIAAYGIYVRSSRDAEATAILADIRLKQEAYRGTFHRYADMNGGGCTTWAPRNPPDEHGVTAAEITTFNATDCALAWRQLGISFQQNQYFVYDSRAGAPGAALDDWWSDANNADFWYGAKAIQNLDANDTCAGFRVVSGNMSIIEITEDGDVCDY